ncbi:MAG: transporter substrate-binding domain-containing protein [Methylotenera sp.]|jgi:general L-amino acid transport system substrate-binding protein|nr:transporter substrate-binding domain-containing protein [Methylotenera sp.]
MLSTLQQYARTARPLILAVIAAALAQPAFAQSAVLDRIKSRGYVTCGASQGVPGLSRPDEKGYFRGFDTDICRSFAAAILGDREKARFVPLNAGQRFLALQTGEIDILPRTSTITYTRDMAVRFVQIYQYDGDAVLVRKKDNIKDGKGLNNKTVCLQGGGSLVENAILETEEHHKIKIKKVYFDSTTQARDAYLAGRCDAYVTDGTAAAAVRATVAKVPDDHLTFRVGEMAEPNGVVIARGDDKLFDIVRWTLNALIWAEARGITSANAEQRGRTGDAEDKRVLGGPGFGKPIGLDDKWVLNVIKQTGNYAEIWDRNLGDKSPMKLPRGMNALWKNGGLYHPYPWD